MPTVTRMLRLVDDPPLPAAYPVPWHVTHFDEAHASIANQSAEAADFVRIFVRSGLTVRTERWGQVLPGEAPDLCLCGTDADDTVVTVAWFRPSTDQEFVWRCVM